MFDANAKMVLHRHKAPTSLVFQGELCLYRPNGDLKEIRPVGSYAKANAERRPRAAAIRMLSRSLATPTSTMSSSGAGRASHQPPIECCRITRPLIGLIS